MKVETFVSIAAEAVTETTYSEQYGFFCGLVTDYNREKRIGNIIILVPPKQWPLNWRAGCDHDVEIQVMIGKLAELRTEETESMYPYALLRDALNDDARLFLRTLNSHSNVQVVNTDISGEYFRADDGPTVNSQEFLRFTFTVKLWNAPDEDEYLFDDLTGLYLITEE
jgi:hypothetical protein